ncbi:MAG: cupin domain-containing protein [Candidatus Diapherotrites archaeon]|nr:cupin domain-containing protein [Candidatus Diapherotrites archaeon]
MGGAGKLNKNWVSIKELIEYPKSGILSKELAKTPKNNITLFCMAKGTELSEHTSTKEGFIYVLEGKGIFNLEGEKIPMKPGICIFMERNAKHSLKAEQNTSFILSLCG